MTLSVGNFVRKVNPTNPDEFVDNESHIIFEVVGTGSIQQKNVDGQYESINVVTVKPVR